MYEVQVLRALFTRNSKIMRSMGTWAFLASLVLLATVARAYHTCGYRPAPEPELCDYDSSSGINRAISSGAEVVTYGEPCFCKESFPYSIQVPQTPPTREEKLMTYGYAVDAPVSRQTSCLQLPVRIQTPIIEHKPNHDYLRGKSYGVTVQHQEYSHPRQLNFDFAVQEPVKVHRPSWKPSMSISVQHQQEYTRPQFSPLPVSIQVPHQKETRITKLNPLSGTVDRVLMPACEVNACPDCNDIVQRRHRHPSPLPPPAFSPC